MAFHRSDRVLASVVAELADPTLGLEMLCTNLNVVSILQFLPMYERAMRACISRMGAPFDMQFPYWRRVWLFRMRHVAVCKRVCISCMGALFDHMRNP